MTDTTATAFGRVLTGLLEERGIEATPETVGQPVIERMASSDAERVEYLSELAEQLDLSYEEMERLALAYSFGQE